MNKHGYQLEQFTDAFERYLPGNTPSQNATTLQANGDGVSAIFKTLQLLDV